MSDVSPLDIADVALAAPGPTGDLTRFLGRVRRLPGGARTSGVHHVSPRAAQPLALLRMLRALQGRLVVVNPAAAVCLPLPTTSLVRGLVQHLTARAPIAPPAAPRDDVPLPLHPTHSAVNTSPAADARLMLEARRVRAFLARHPSTTALGTDWDWCAVGLGEPRASVIGAQPPAGGVAAAGTSTEFVAELPYRLVLVVGRGAAPAPQEIGERVRAAVAQPALTTDEVMRGTPWFSTDVLLPDDEALARMDMSAAATYRRLTGRSDGEGAVDAYWHLSSWERYVEAGRVAGHVSPAFIARRPVVARSTRPAWDADVAYVSSGAVAHQAALTPRHDVGFLIPPGYCLLRCHATLAVQVIAAPDEEL